MHRRFVMAGAIAVAVTAALVSGSRASGAARAQEGAPYLGSSVAVSGDGTTALVGASGRAFVFHVADAGSWSSTGTPTATLTFGARYGGPVALSADGTTAFVGTHKGGYPAIEVFRATAEDAWASSSTPTATLTVASPNYFAGPFAVSSDGTTLIAPAVYINDIGFAAVVFHVSNEDAWATSSTPTAKLTSQAGGGDDAVAISGDGATALLTDSADYTVGGAAYLYHVADAGSWTSSSTPTAVLTDANAGTGMEGSDSLGHYLALSGDGTVALLGTQPYSSKLPYVDVFHASDAASWVSTSTPTATLTKAGGSRDDDFGAELAVSGDGATVLVRAPGANRGPSYIFHVSGEGAWASSSAPTATLVNSGDARMQAGSRGTLSADGATVVVGTPIARWWTGAAEVFHVSDAGSWAPSATPTATLTVSALNRCVVPKLKGLTVAVAKPRLRARSCRLGRVTRVVSATGKSGRVVSQSQKPGARLAVGTKVSIKVAK